jgi:beta-glucosidase
MSLSKIFIIRKILSVIILAMICISCANTRNRKDPKKNDPFSQKVDSVLHKMTLEEKVGQMTLFTSGMTKTGPTMRSDYKKLIKQGKVGAVFNAYGADYTRKLQELAVDSSRLGIPLIFGYDVIHGFRTIFPVPLGQAAAWNPDLTRQVDSIAAREATSEGLQWAYGPMVDIARDPRWGRIVEGAGEDPYLGSKIAAAAVHGFQGDSLSSIHTVMASVKHYAAYGAAIGGRPYNTVNMSRRLLRNVYLLPYKAAVKAGAATLMTAFNEFDGVPATDNKFLLNKILRDEWGFQGFVVTDYTSMPETVVHGFAKNDKQAAQLALEANVDMDMQGGLYLKYLPKLIKEGKVSEKQINQAVRRILRMKFELGLFKDPYRYCNKQRQKKEILSKSNLQKEREIARKTFVLLKNKHSLLPLKKNIKKLAVIGPLADDKVDLLGPWSGAGQAKDNITLLAGIKKAVSSSTSIKYAKGTGIKDSSTAGFAKAKKIAGWADVAVVALGESRSMSGEAASRAHLDLPGNQLQLLKALQKTGTPVVLVLMNGRPLAISWAAKHIPAILETWFAGTEGGPAISDVLFGDYNPSGRLTATFLRFVGQVPLFYDHKNTGRPAEPNNKYTSKYLDIKTTPLYPFGFGLSYTTFQYKHLSLSADTIGMGDSLRVSVDVTNTGQRAGKATAQLYIRDLVGSVTRPVKELKGFKKVKLQPGQTKRVHFAITPKKLSFYNINMKFVEESGKFVIMAGSSSRNKDLLKKSLVLQK